MIHPSGTGVMCRMLTGRASGGYSAINWQSRALVTVESTVSPHPRRPMFRRLAVMIAISSTLLTPPAAAATAIVDVAHRGASAYPAATTIPAFEPAAKPRADVFALDVQETKDHELVLMPDTPLARTPGVERAFPGHAPWRVG